MQGHQSKFIWGGANNGGGEGLKLGSEAGRSGASRGEGFE